MHGVPSLGPTLFKTWVPSIKTDDHVWQAIAFLPWWDHFNANKEKKSGRASNLLALAQQY